jgi:hypothetical protein
MTKKYLSTGQTSCHDVSGQTVPCAGSGQDAEFQAGCTWPEARFEVENEWVLDQLTGLTWTRNANLAEYPLTWQEALDFVADLNRQLFLGFSDWRLPNRRELRSLMSHQTRKPALPEGHPFTHIFLSWYWTSTSAAISPAHAWYVHMEGARLFYGGKDQSYLLWPVRGSGNEVLPATGQDRCFGAHGQEISCNGTGQDGELRTGSIWPAPRFIQLRDRVLDRLTGVAWMRRASVTRDPVNWNEALAAVVALNRSDSVEAARWRLPNINELESLVNCATHTPALPQGHPFEDVQSGYWSSTTSAFEPDWAWALYLDKGAIGVGQKCDKHFYVWAVCDND